MNLSDWLQIHQLNIKNRTLIDLAFIHRSYLHEHPQEVLEDNQRLEFIGDAVLQLWTAEYLFKLDLNYREGQMTKIRSSMVSEPALAKIAIELGLNQYLKLGVGEKKEQGQIRESTVADMFEAFVGALYLDGGYSQVHPFLYEIFKQPERFINNEKTIDHKTQLQEYVQVDRARTIQYVLIDTNGPPNQRIFEVAVKIDEITYGRGKGSSKKRAEQAAAQEALNKLVK